MVRYTLELMTCQMTFSDDPMEEGELKRLQDERETNQYSATHGLVRGTSYTN